MPSDVPILKCPVDSYDGDEATPLMASTTWITGDTDKVAIPFPEGEFSFDLRAGAGPEALGGTLLSLRIDFDDSDRLPIIETIDLGKVLPVWVTTALERARARRTVPTLADFWRGVHGDEARWRTARREGQTCSNHGRMSCPDVCVGTIIAGDEYFDTGEVVGQWATSKLCKPCADSPSPVVVRRARRD